MKPITEDVFKEVIYEINRIKPLTSWELDFLKTILRYIKKKQEEENEIPDTNL